MAEVLGTIYGRQTNTSNANNPRDALAQVLRRLEVLGIVVLTGTEMEFRMLYCDTGEPPFSEPDFCSQFSFALQEDVLFYIENNLHSAGIEIEGMHIETLTGIFEYTSRPQEGIKAADDVCLFKTYIEELARKKDMLISFDSIMGGLEVGLALHFNFSLWNKQGKNILYDNSGHNDLSKTAYHWIAGLVKHAGALTALCVPTVSCYKRFGHFPEPSLANWGVNNRFVTFRLRNAGENGTYIENRLPSALANPYLVMAGTLAAGLDGIENQLQCPPMEDKMAKPIPTNLAEALTALEKDLVIKASLGKDLISAYIDSRREYELPEIN